MANKKARILVDKLIDGVQYKCNQVIDADSALIKELVKEGAVDDHPSAVKHCTDNEGEEPILHQSPPSTKAEAKRAAASAALTAEIAQLEADYEAAAEADKPAIQTAWEAKQAELAAL